MAQTEPKVIRQAFTVIDWRRTKLERTIAFSGSVLLDQCLSIAGVSLYELLTRLSVLIFARYRCQSLSMKDIQIETLSNLKVAFELEEDWVAVGHVAFLLERLIEKDIVHDRCCTPMPTSLTLH